MNSNFPSSPRGGLKTARRRVLNDYLPIPKDRLVQSQASGKLRPVPILAALAFAALVASLLLDVVARLRPPRSHELRVTWSEIAAPGAPVKMDQPAHWAFRRSAPRSWLWNLGRFELEAPLPPHEVAKRLKQALRTEPAYALFLPIGGRAVGWVEDGRFQASLIGGLSRHPSSWIADGALVPAGDGTVLRSDFIVRKSRLLLIGVFAAWILVGALWLASAEQLTVAVLTVVGLAVYLGLLCGASWLSGRRLQHFLVETVSPTGQHESESVGYASMIRDIEDEMNPSHKVGQERNSESAAPRARPRRRNR